MKIPRFFPQVLMQLTAGFLLSGCQAPAVHQPSPGSSSGAATLVMPDAAQWETPLILPGDPKPNPTATVQLQVTLVKWSGPGAVDLESKALTAAEVAPFLRGLTALPGNKITRLDPSATRDEKEWVLENMNPVSFPLPNGGGAQVPVGWMVRVLPSCQDDGRIRVQSRLFKVEIDRTKMTEDQDNPVPKATTLNAQRACRDGGAVFFSIPDGAAGRLGILIQVSKR